MWRTPTHTHTRTHVHRRNCGFPLISRQQDEDRTGTTGGGVGGSGGGEGGSGGGKGVMGTARGAGKVGGAAGEAVAGIRDTTENFAEEQVGVGVRLAEQVVLLSL